MGWQNAIEWPVQKIRGWIADGKTHAWIGARLGRSPKLIYKVCKKHGIRCQRRGPRAGPGHTGWKGGRILDKHGYVLVYAPGHHLSRGPKKRYALEHRIVMEKKLGRRLRPGEVVHHLNGVKADNREENLGLFASNAEHLRHELTGRCPKWTPEGRARTLAGVRRENATRKALARGAGSSPRKTPRNPA